MFSTFTISIFAPEKKNLICCLLLSFLSTLSLGKSEFLGHFELSGCPRTNTLADWTLWRVCGSFVCRRLNRAIEMLSLNVLSPIWDSYNVHHRLCFQPTVYQRLLPHRASWHSWPQGLCVDSSSPTSQQHPQDHVKEASPWVHHIQIRFVGFIGNRFRWPVHHTEGGRCDQVHQAANYESSRGTWNVELNRCSKYQLNFNCQFHKNVHYWLTGFVHLKRKILYPASVVPPLDYGHLAPILKWLLNSSIKILGLQINPYSVTPWLLLSARVQRSETKFRLEHLINLF